VSIDEPLPNRGAQLLKRWRTRLGLTQSRACVLIECDFSTFSKFESSKMRPGYARARRIEDGTSGAVPMQAWSQPAKESKRRGSA
jgi:transcriptional regulator with XRE-family HTH domain